MKYQVTVRIARRGVPRNIVVLLDTDSGAEATTFLTELTDVANSADFAERVAAEVRAVRKPIGCRGDPAAEGEAAGRRDNARLKEGAQS